MSAEMSQVAADLAALMKERNRWAAKVAELQKAARELEAPPPSTLELRRSVGALQQRVQHLEGELQRAWRELDESRAAAAQWEQKARALLAREEFGR